MHILTQYRFHVPSCILYVCRRTMQRAGPRAPRRSPTPTSATFPNSISSDSMPPPSPSSTNGQKPLYLCSPFVEAALVKGNFKTIVMLPKYVDITEWVAVNSAYDVPILESFDVDRHATVFDFFQNLNMFYGVVSECCTKASCPTMTAGPSYVCLSCHVFGILSLKWQIASCARNIMCTDSITRGSTKTERASSSPRQRISTT